MNAILPTSLQRPSFSSSSFSLSFIIQNPHSLATVHMRNPCFPSFSKGPPPKMVHSIQSNRLDSTLSTPLLPKSTATSDSDGGPTSPLQFSNYHIPDIPVNGSCRSLAVLSGHVGSVSCLALCGEFVLSASQGKDIIVWQQPDLRRFAKFGQGDGVVKALVTVGNRVFTAHQDSRIRVWKVSRSSENIFKLVATLPTAKDYLGKFMKQSNYVQTRRNHRRLWIEHADSISCLAICNGMIYSGSWDKTLKVWRISDLKCLESIKAHDDAINGLVADNEVVYSASADGKIKVWGQGKSLHCLKGVMVGHKDVSLNSVNVCDDGMLVYGGGSDGYVLGWKRDDGGLENWTLVCEMKTHRMAVLCLCLMGEFVCSGSADKSIGIWKREAGGGLCSVRVIKGHEGPVKCLQASCYNVGGGYLLYSGGLDRSLRVWWVPKAGHDEKEGSTQVIGIDKNKCIMLC
ncbi:protein JINGUBANG [Magnolia sinica]|uniref:protein JINGUBANG n=1 Tax=Magnolia sinica TaxID=86752 RepID=UPI002659ACD4|nr:protein JINGUBANG [Magnolia sinica]